MKFLLAVPLLVIITFFFNCAKPAAKLPFVTTDPVTAIDGESATSGGSITGENITDKGVCWSTTNYPTIANAKISNGAGTDHYESKLTGLNPKTKYYLRAYATNAAGTAYGDPVDFTTKLSASDRITDVDGNQYKIIEIGTQVWMAENLKVTRFRNGDSIPNVLTSVDWSTISTPAYCCYDNIPSNANIYGNLYNWYIVSDPRNIAPVGWHVASRQEWEKLINYLGGLHVASKKMIVTGSAYGSYNSDATNESGFTALPAANRKNGAFTPLNTCAVFWTNAIGTTDDNHVNILPTDILVVSSTNKESGFSIRCVKD